MTHVTKITKNHFFSSLTKNLAKYIFSPKSIFCSNFPIIQIFRPCATFWPCKWPIFPYFTLKSNIHHVSNITSLIHIIKINVNSNYFELTSIVHITGQNSIKTPFFTISHKIMQIFPPTTIWGISR